MPGNPLTDPNWAPELADTVERVVGAVRDKSTVKAVKAVRALVFGIIVGVLALVALVLVVVVLTKLLQRILTTFGWVHADSSVGLSYLVMGVLLAIGGFVCMRRRTVEEAS